ncbi:uncharacterized protein ARB_00626 [Trichophyton benhamiae CBS 112371]|uniref:Uncharacterized protein n=1 Tax=Arthroderma benhamiae (strain ATCC MYA-4681 / CBS 112371) TaxID=663331 RepID=D4AWR0_ARTBC|nr:uncharacterized protein ARB_00626 [Trichophyton benhamiae CBS 112371]EFE32441.1 hypothetical protein ARB_00626 [Trichophyton benhamiae CBS 112371]
MLEQVRRRLMMTEKKDIRRPCAWFSLPAPLPVFLPPGPSKLKERCRLDKFIKEKQGKERKNETRKQKEKKKKKDEKRQSRMNTVEETKMRRDKNVIIIPSSESVK